MDSDASQENEITLGEAIQLGIQAQQQGKSEQAEEIYRRILAVAPDCADAWHYSGLLAFQRKEMEQAVTLIEKSLALAPKVPGFWNNFGNVLKELGDKTEATVAYRNAIALQPDFADAHNNLGVMASQSGDFAAAAEAYRQALFFQPTHADAQLNLGHACVKLELLDEAVEAYRATTRLRPGNPEAYGRLGHLFWHQGKQEEAIEAILANTELEKNDPMAFVFLGGIFFEQGRNDESLEAYRQAVEIDPKNSQANRLLGLGLARAGKTAEAREVWRKWSEADPENPVPKHHFLAGTDDATPARAEDAFVVHEFDRFAETFDKKLLHLQYRAPELIVEALAQRVVAAGTLNILDAGCGTGLCGPLLRPFAHKLEGVDLSPGMIEKARGRGGYDELVVEELTAFIAARKDVYDAIVSADTLCYFGRLEAVLQAAAEALKSGGYFIFTVEKTPESAGAARLTLDNSGRYTHTETYIRSAVAGSSLLLDELAFVTLRMELFDPVEGMLVVARKSRLGGK